MTSTIDNCGRRLEAAGAANRHAKKNQKSSGESGREGVPRCSVELSEEEIDREYGYGREFELVGFSLLTLFGDF